MSGATDWLNLDGGFKGIGLERGTHFGHQVVQVGMSSDALPYYRCRGCTWSAVGRLPDASDRPCDGD